MSRELNNNIHNYTSAKAYDNCIVYTNSTDVILNGISTYTTCSDSINNNLNTYATGKPYDQILSYTKGKNANEITTYTTGNKPTKVVFNFLEQDISNFEVYSNRFFNKAILQYNYDWEDKEYKSSITKKNQYSIDLYGEVKVTRPYQLIQDRRAMNKIADSLMFTVSIPEIKISFRHNISSFYIEEGDICTVTHSKGLGVGGYNKRKFIITKKKQGNFNIDYEGIIYPIDNYKYQSTFVSATSAVGYSKPIRIEITKELQYITFTVYTSDSVDKPVQGALISIKDLSETTNVNGMAFFDITVSGEYTAFIRVEGYETTILNFTVNSITQNITQTFTEVTEVTETPAPEGE